MWKPSHTISPQIFTLFFLLFFFFYILFYSKVLVFMVPFACRCCCWVKAIYSKPREISNSFIWCALFYRPFYWTALFIVYSLDKFNGFYKWQFGMMMDGLFMHIREAADIIATSGMTNCALLW